MRKEVTYYVNLHHRLVHLKNKDFGMEQKSTKSRDDLIFEIYYSHNIELLRYHLNLRVSNLIMFMQLLLSSAIVGDLKRYVDELIPVDVILGFLITLLTILSFVYKFSEKSVRSEIQSSYYNNLISRIDELDDEKLREALYQSHGLDTNATGAILDIAYKRASIQLEKKDSTKLTCYQTFIASLAGEYFDNDDKDKEHSNE